VYKTALTLAITFVACACSGSRDADVVTVALEHFIARPDTMPYHESGVTLIETQTQKWVPGMGDSGAKCEVSQELHDRLVARNAARQPASALLTTSKKWRLIQPDDVKKSDPLLLWHDKTAAGEPIRTVVQLSKPAYSESGDSAVVVLSFRWSIHSATARYVLESSGNDWRVQCSDLFFYV
jgi:hypothetical protein